MDCSNKERERKLYKHILGKHIRWQRKKAGITLPQLGHDINMDSKHLSRIENGKKLPSAQTKTDIELRIGRLPDIFYEEYKTKIEQLYDDG